MCWAGYRLVYELLSWVFNCGLLLVIVLLGVYLGFWLVVLFDRFWVDWLVWAVVWLFGVWCFFFTCMLVLGDGWLHQFRLCFWCRFCCWLDLRCVLLL